MLPTPPIDFGAYKFCKTCGICADACPFGLIQKGDPTWENPASAKSGIQQGTFEAGEPIPQIVLTAPPVRHLPLQQQTGFIPACCG
ncbi:Tetrachloroethene reductive dehalogenase TceA [Dehalococcoides mccartyi]|uniref:Tetrachloroethene reductive dehalogenase TceA n=1 Tax=Dehalococcoides mccartyi TaxID=61435 RepID=A0A328EN66_9CHLR|nr:Tetrachloroethene reductive dehalogenase TceA [Dehalococcoides mccartyi]RAL70212.1 Tetrachloroethene reductive dehalogenase TceA [Dehalococcoides mccartyi]